MSLVVLYTPKKYKKTEVFSCLEVVGRKRPVAWNGLICSHKIFETFQIGLQKKFFEIQWHDVMFSTGVFLNIFEVLKNHVKTIRTTID